MPLVPSDHRHKRLSWIFSARPSVLDSSAGGRNGQRSISDGRPAVEGRTNGTDRLLARLRAVHGPAGRPDLWAARR